MHKLIIALTLSAALAAPAVWAQDYGTTDEYTTDETTQKPGTAGDVQTEEESITTETTESTQEPGTVDTSGTTTTTAEEATKGYLKDEIVSMKPQIGVLLFKDNLDQSTSRAAAGLTMDMNLTKMINENLRNWNFGPSTGVIYSHLGSANSNFFGTTDEGGTQAGANFFYIPLNLKAGYNIGERFQIAAHGGGNLTYRSIGTSLNLGPSTATSDSVWKVYPNVGADLTAAIAENVALSARPDFTFTPGNDLFTGTLALQILLG